MEPEVSKEIYLNNQIITKPSDEILKELFQISKEKWGDLTSGLQIKQQLEKETQKYVDMLTSCLKVSSRHMCYSSVGIEDLYFRYFIDFYTQMVRSTGRNHFLSPSIVDRAMYGSIKYLEKLGCVYHRVPIGLDGVIQLELLENLLTPKVSLFCFSGGHSLTGVIQPLQKIVDICHAKNVKVLVDISHMIGKVDLNDQLREVDFISFQADKFHSPQGLSGFFFLPPFTPSNDHPHLFSLTGIGLAVRQQIKKQDFFMTEIPRLRSVFEKELKLALPQTNILFQDSSKLPHIITLNFPGIMAEALLYQLYCQDFYATIGGGEVQTLETVLKYCGFPDEISQTALSFALSEFTTEDILADALEVIVSSVRKLQKISMSL